MGKPRSSQTSDGKLARVINLVAAIAWAAIVPVAWALHWLSSVSFISAASIYANFASHIAAWRSDVNPQLDRIEAMLEELLDDRSK